MSRIEKRFAELKAKSKKALIGFTVAGDPDMATSAKLLAGLPKAGVDIVELSIPFSDPMADGPVIQIGNLRAFKAGITLEKTLGMVHEFRKTDNDTPLVLMGYYNPIYSFGVEKFLEAAKAAGADGLIVVDLPPEEDAELCNPAKKRGFDFIRLITPTTDKKRLPAVLKSASGFIYYVSIAGITGTRAADSNAVGKVIADLRQSTSLPIAIGFGIATPEQAKDMAAQADGVIVGSAIVRRIEANLDASGNAKPGLTEDVLGFIADLAKAVH